MRRSAARFRSVTAVRSFGATLLNGVTAAVVISAALQALVTATKFEISHAAGRLICTALQTFVAAVELGVCHATGTHFITTGELGRATVLGLVGIDSSDQ